MEKATGEKAEEEEVDNTMEEEIAQFREAAAMVGDIVAAEEGRARRTRQDRYTNDVEGEDVDSPPSYESVSNDSSVVANGFRYNPDGPNKGSDDRTP